MKLSKTLLTVMVALIALTALTATAAAKPTIAVLGLEVKDAGGGLDEQTTKVATQLTDALRVRARNASGPFRLAPNSKKDLLELKLLSGCGDEKPTCMAGIGSELGADRLLFGRITRRSKGFQVSLDLLNVKTAAMERSTSEIIPFGEIDADGLARWATSLYSRLVGVPEEGNLIIRADAEAGTVYVDGNVKATLAAGSATIRGLSVGPHTVGVESEGRETWAGEVTVRAGADSTLEVAMVPKASVRFSGKTSKSRPGGTARALFWTSLVLTGASSAAVIVTGLQVRGNLKDDKFKALEELKERADNPITLNSPDACGAAKQLDQTDTGVRAVVDACDAGTSRATLTNIFVSTSILSAIAASYFYYKGFMSNGSRSGRERANRGESAVHIVPSVGPGHIGAGVALEF